MKFNKPYFKYVSQKSELNVSIFNFIYETKTRRSFEGLLFSSAIWRLILLCDRIIREKNIARLMRRSEEFEEFGTARETFLIKNTEYVFNKFYNPSKAT